uniref:Uncharacterized protein n=1 Tax=Setaria italica TaxID=4555 RepID=A0A0Q3RWW1_SETIT
MRSRSRSMPCPLIRIQAKLRVHLPRRREPRRRLRGLHQEHPAHKA